jgi:prephenate dehydratase
MAVRKVSYCYVTVPNRPGQGAQVLAALKAAKVNLLAYSGFPVRAGKAQLDFVAEDLGSIQRVTRKYGWRLSPRKKGFLVQGKDRPGEVHRHIRKLADAKINVTAAEAVVAGRGRYGMLVWVKDRDYGRAARALKAK